MTISTDILLDTFPYLNIQACNALLLTSRQLSRLVMPQLKSRFSRLMAHKLRIKLLDKELLVHVSENYVTQNTIKSRFLLSPSSIVSLCYEDDDGLVGCESRSSPEPCFLLPNDWNTKKFVAESNVITSRPVTSLDDYQNMRPGPSYYIRSESPDRGHLLPAPSAKYIERYMFYAVDAMSKSSVVCIHSRFFVTFRHGSHLELNVGDKFMIYKGKEIQTEATSLIGIKVVVASIHDALDFILLKSESNVVERGPPLVSAEEAQPFTLASFGNEEQSLSYLPGTVYSVQKFYSNFQGNINRMGPFFSGTCRTSVGDSGGGCWGAYGLIGMNVACTMMPTTDHHSAISQAAIFSSKNIMSPSLMFEEAYGQELDKERRSAEISSPPTKKPCTTVDYAGIGTGYGNFE